jgi:DivIVA domain-containing protein
MEETSSALTAEDVRGITFDKPPWGERGFDEADVDALLDRIATAIANLDENRV